VNHVTTGRLSHWQSHAQLCATGSRYTALLVLCTNAEGIPVAARTLLVVCQDDTSQQCQLQGWCRPGGQMIWPGFPGLAQGGHRGQLYRGVPGRQPCRAQITVLAAWLNPVLQSSCTARSTDQPVCHNAGCAYPIQSGYGQPQRGPSKHSVFHQSIATVNLLCQVDGPRLGGGPYSTGYQVAQHQTQHGL